MSNSRAHHYIDDNWSALDNKVVSIQKYARTKSTSSQATDYGEQPAWQANAVEKVCQLLELPEYWDSYQSPKIDPQLGMFVLQVLNNFMSAEISTPEIYPSSVGGIQLEWHIDSSDFELHIPEPYAYEFYLNDIAGEEEKELSGSSLAQLEEFFMRLRRQISYVQADMHIAL